MHVREHWEKKKKGEKRTELFEVIMAENFLI